jgi:hypothetical protein
VNDAPPWLRLTSAWLWAHAARPAEAADVVLLVDSPIGCYPEMEIIAQRRIALESVAAGITPPSVCRRWAI